MERFYMNHNTDTNILTIEVTEGVAFSIMETFREVIPIEMMGAHLDIIDVETDEGQKYKGVLRYTTKCLPDKIYHFYECAKKQLRLNIQESIGHSNN